MEFKIKQQKQKREGEDEREKERERRELGLHSQAETAQGRMVTLGATVLWLRLVIHNGSGKSKEACAN